MGLALETIGMSDEEWALRRIEQLERFNATLSQQVDRQAKVVDAAIAWCNKDTTFTLTNLLSAVALYQQQLAQLTRGGG
jgi:hypothetical protein